MLHLSLLKRFPLFIWLLFAVSSLSNFLPDTGGRRWSLVQVRLVSHAAGREGHCRQISVACVGSTHSVLAILGLPRSRVCALPIYTSQAPGCSIWSGPCIACGPSFRVLHKSADSVAPAFCAFPGPSGSGSQQLNGRTLPGCSAPSPHCQAQPQFPHVRQSGECTLFSGAGL